MLMMKHPLVGIIVEIVCVVHGEHRSDPEEDAGKKREEYLRWHYLICTTRG